MSAIKTKVVEVAFDRIGKRYPNFDPESGKKMVNSLTDVYKTFRKKSDPKPIDQSDSLLLPPSHGTTTINLVNTTHSEKRGSYYENLPIHDQNIVKIPGIMIEEKSSETQTKDKPTELQNGGVGAFPPVHMPSPSAPSEQTKDCVPVVPPIGVTPPAVPGGPTKGPDISHYLQKKSLAQGMLDLALLSANTNQLRYILESKGDNFYYNVSLTLIISSLVLQVFVGLLLVWNSNYNVQRKSGFASADRINNLSVFGVFLITLINVFISTFGGVPAASPLSSSAKIETPTTPGSVVIVDPTAAAPPIVENIQIADVGGGGDVGGGL